MGADCKVVDAYTGYAAAVLNVRRWHLQRRKL